MLTWESKAPDTTAVHPEQPPVRVLHVLEATLGGTLRYLENIAESLSPEDFHLGFAYGTSRADSRLEPFLERIKKQGWATFPLPMLRAISVQSELLSIVKLRQALHSFRPDILHCHSSKAGVLGRVAAKLVYPSPHVIYSPHALAVSLGKHYLYIERVFQKLADSFLAVSDSEAAEILSYGLAPASRVSIVYPMIDPEYFKPAARAEGVQGKPERVVLGIGRLTAQKDPLQFVRIVRALQGVAPGVKGIWMGDGELRDAFLAACSSSGAPGLIELVPWQHDVRPYLGRADVLLSTSAYESFGYMVAEALSMEVPVVATAVNGTRDILMGEFAGNTFAPGDEATAVMLLEEVLNNPQASQRWAARGREMVQSRFGREAMRLALRTAYGQAAGQQFSRVPASRGAR